MKLSKDIRTAFLLRGMKMVLRPVLWYGFFLVVLLEYVVFGEYEIRLTHIPVYIALAFVLLMPFFLGWVKEAFKVSAFTGTITDIAKSRELITDREFGRRGLSGAHYVNVLTMTVTTTKGKKKTIVHREPGFFDIDYFTVGDEVTHFWGAEYLDKHIKHGDKDILCLVCGEMSRSEKETCAWCRRNLQKQEYLKLNGDNTFIK